MALQDYNEEYRVERKNKNVVICIYQKPLSDNNHINYSIEKLQKSLFQNLDEETVLCKAFVFSDDGNVCARDFEQTDSENIYYADFCKKESDLSHIWFMAMALLEKKTLEDEKNGVLSDNYIYLVTDEVFKRSYAEKIKNSLRFKELKTTPILVKCEKAGGGSLEEYMRKEGKIYLDTDL